MVRDSGEIAKRVDSSRRDVCSTRRLGVMLVIGLRDHPSDHPMEKPNQHTDQSCGNDHHANDYRDILHERFNRRSR
jgi:hypothetical protein